MCNLNELVREVTAPKEDEAVADWLEAQMSDERRFLLAHTDDGVIWGRWDDNRLLTSHQVAVGTDSEGISPPLNGVIVQQAFVFGEQSEIRLFRDELGDWTAREIGNHAEDDGVLVESQLLIGDEAIKGWPKDGFTHLRDKKQQGLDQIVPLSITKADIADDERPRLRIHHFITYDEDSGEARIGLSCLAHVYLGKEENPV